MSSFGIEESPLERGRAILANESLGRAAQAGSGRTQLHDDPVVDVVLAEALVSGTGDIPGAIPDVVAVIDDEDGLFVDAVLELGVRVVRVFSDFGINHALPEHAHEETPDGSLFNGVELVVGRLPKSLAELEDLAECINMHAERNVQVILGAREKHLRHSMTERLGKYFQDVRGTRGIRKSRAIVATGSLLPRPEFPRATNLEELELVVAARGGAFAGTSLDLGTRVLIEALAGPRPGTISLPKSDRLGANEIETAVDLGCGTGLLACVLARSFPETKVIATDASWWACASAEVTAEANGFADRIEVVRSNAGDGIESESVDLVLCNPPFHAGRQVDPGLANELFRGAARMLRPGGQMFTVFNSHLKHRHHLENIVGPTEQVNRTEKFTVTVSTKR